MYVMSIWNIVEEDYIAQVFCDTYNEAECEANTVLMELENDGYPMNEVAWNIKPYAKV